MAIAADDTIPPSVRKLRFADWAALTLTAMPVVVLAIMALAWLRYGIDLPFRDDWREYLSGQIASFDFSHLFRPDNDTLSPITRILDALAQRHLDGNSVAYQLLSMLFVLGSLLWLQYKLLQRVLHDRFLVACAFSATLFMLQPDSYWGHQNLAYIQALPLVFILAALYVTLQQEQPGWLKATATFILGILSGLTYISGAFATLALSLALLLACAWRPGLRHWVSKPALGSLLAGILTSALQLWVILGVQHGRTHRADAPWALPVDADFWFYLLGKVGRSLMLPASSPALSLTLSCIAIAATIVTALVLLLRKSPAHAHDAAMRNEAGALILLSLLASTGIYLCLVSAGRANFRPASIESNLQVFQFAYHRFHFFWVTLLWPWLFAGIVLLSKRTIPGERRYIVWGFIALLLAVFAIDQGATSHFKTFKDVSVKRTSTDLACLRRKLEGAGGIVCPTLAPYGDLRPAFRYAIRTGASFIRYLPPTMAGSDPGSGPQFIMAFTDPSSYRVVHSRVEHADAHGLQLSGARDPMIIFSTGKQPALSDCVALQVVADVWAAYADRAQLFYRPMGVEKFNEHDSIRVDLKKGGSRVNFVAVSPTGFTDRIRLDPVANYQPSRVTDLAVRCLY